MNKLMALLLGASFMFALPAQAQDGGDPLAQFRVEPNTTGEFDDTEEDDGQVDIPTIGGFQDAAPQNYGQYSIDPELSIEEQQAEIEEKMRETAYEAALTGLMPMNPDEIREFLRYYGESRKASEQRLGGTPKPKVKIETVSLDPGVTFAWVEITQITHCQSIQSLGSRRNI